jgi:hypothetical protein
MPLVTVPLVTVPLVTVPLVTVPLVTVPLVTVPLVTLPLVTLPLVVVPVGLGDAAPAGFAYITIIGMTERCFAHGGKPLRERFREGKATML